jgi:uroporphyrinogen-III decarboxylase
MSSRERVLAACRGLPVDRTPVWLWLNPHATCRLIARHRPSRSRAVTAFCRAVWHRFERGDGAEAGLWARALPLLMEDFGNARYCRELGSDVATASPSISSPSGLLGAVRVGHGTISVRTPFGATLALRGIYMHPAAASVSGPADLAALRLPPPCDRWFDPLRRLRRADPEAFILAEISSLQQLACDYALGTESFMYGLYDAYEEIRRFVARLAEWILGLLQGAAAAGADAVLLQDDYGGESGPLISMDMWRNLTLPHLRRLAAAAHEQRVLFALHSCGHQMPFLPHYLEAGVDLLHPLQPKAGNDLKTVCGEVRGRLCLATGIDIQRGERMGPAVFRKDILERCRLGQASGKFLLATTHMLQYTMSEANLEAMFGALEELRSAGR